MQWQLLWYVLAGLIIGLTASTLWEWLYFRRKRMELRDRRLTELEAEVRMLREQNRELAAAATRSMPVATDYHSPAVFLESEEAESLREDAYAPQLDDIEPSAPVADAPDVEFPDTETLTSGDPVVKDAENTPPGSAIVDAAERLPNADADAQDELKLDGVTEPAVASPPEPPFSLDEDGDETDVDVDTAVAASEGQKGDEDGT